MSIIPLSFSFLFLIFLHLPSVCFADIGTAAWYPPPYSPVACYGSDASQFPSSYLFGVAGEGIWDNGAACGRQYKIRCLSAVAAGSWQSDQTIQVKEMKKRLRSEGLGIEEERHAPFAFLF